jgi:predicted O-methyltransferase YrrM
MASVEILASSGDWQMNLKQALATEGFMELFELEYLAHAASKSKRILEIGSWKGRSAIAMASNTDGLVYCVDTWSGHLDASDHFSAECFKDFIRNTKGFTNIIPFPLESLQAAAIFQRFGFQFDFIFIDGRHDYEGVVRDLVAWAPLLAPGAILAGHDYGHPDWPDVKTAVDELVPQAHRVTDTNIWTTEAA